MSETREEFLKKRRETLVEVVREDNYRTLDDITKVYNAKLEDKLKYKKTVDRKDVRIDVTKESISKYMKELNIIKHGSVYVVQEEYEKSKKYEDELSQLPPENHDYDMKLTLLPNTLKIKEFLEHLRIEYPELCINENNENSKFIVYYPSRLNLKEEFEKERKKLSKEAEYYKKINDINKH